VAVRVPNHDVALAVLKATGPLAVSSANLTGEPAATTIDEAERMLGDAVAVYLDAGTSPGGVASTILDVTAPTPRILRDGPVGIDVLHRFNNTIEAGV
jgi:tRNA A37 threonylcarbamoyladenosine synthetase subunit TsaC/SUA5/YrdC